MSWLDEEVLGQATVLDLILFIALMVAAIVVAKFVNQLIRRKLDERMGVRFSKTLARMALYLIIASAMVFGFSKLLHQDFSGLLLSLGLVGVAIAFASQQIIMNVLSGLMISITRIIQLEDWVEVGGAPTTGVARVKDINLTNTMLRDTEGRLIVVPNAQIINGKVINYTRAGFVAIPLDLWLDSSTDLKTIRRIVLEVADLDPYILPKVNEEERRITQNIFERPYIRNLFGGDGDLSRLNPQVNILDLREGKIKINIRVWLRQVHRRDEIVSGFLAAVSDRFKLDGIDLRDP
jgi:small-conductance mechanosensitive channel